MLAVVVAAAVVFAMLKMFNGEDAANETDSVKEQVTKVEEQKEAQMPQFKGDMQKFIKANLRYPASAKKEGAVRLSFTVEDDGTTSHIVVKKGVEPIIDKEAVRLCTLMRFTPATDDEGEPTEAVYALEIEFKRPSSQQAQPAVKQEAKKEEPKPTAIEAAALRSIMHQGEDASQSGKTKTEQTDK